MVMIKDWPTFISLNHLLSIWSSLCQWRLRQICSHYVVWCAQSSHCLCCTLQLVAHWSVIVQAGFWLSKELHILFTGVSMRWMESRPEERRMALHLEWFSIMVSTVSLPASHHWSLPESCNLETILLRRSSSCLSSKLSILCNSSTTTRESW